MLAEMMKLVQFHRAMGQTIGNGLAMRDHELRANLIEEEAKETVDAIRRGDFLEAIDGIADLLYVVYGTALAFGIEPSTFFEEVHRANMAKAAGPVREDGKRLKPEGWKPPNIAAIFEYQRHNPVDWNMIYETFWKKDR